ncbi:MAG: hypothetical protein AB7F19_03635 [Candidatus Babeliales bacterium]
MKLLNSKKLIYINLFALVFCFNSTQSMEHNPSVSRSEDSEKIVYNLTLPNGEEQVATFGKRSNEYHFSRLLPVVSGPLAGTGVKRHFFTTENHEMHYNRLKLRYEHEQQKMQKEPIK